MTHVVIDNGAGCVKFGILGHSVPALETPNFKGEPRAQSGGKRSGAIGERKLDELRSGYTADRPLQAGLLLDAATELEVWQHGIAAILPKYTTLNDAHITFTETPATPPSVYASLLEMLFETLGVASVAAVPTTLCNTLAFPSNAVLHSTGSPAGAVRTVNASPFPDSPTLKYDYDVFGSGIIPGNEGRVLIDMGFTGVVCAPAYRGVVIESACFRNYCGAHSVNLALQRAVEYRAVNLGGFYHLVDRLRRRACYVTPSQNLVQTQVRTLSDNLKRLGRNLRSYDENLCEKSTEPFVYDPRTENVMQAPDLSLIANEQQLREAWQGKVLLGPERASMYESIFNGSLGNNEPFIARSSLERGICIPVRQWGGGYPKIRPQEQSVKVWPAASVVHLSTQSIFGAPPLLQKSVANVICLAGSVAEVPGCVPRIAEELRAALPSDWPINIVRLKPARITTWVGACVWSSSPKYAAAVLTKERYREVGGGSSLRAKRVRVDS